MNEKFNNFKHKINRKMLLNSFSILLVIVLIVISSVAQAGIDPSYWTTWQFITSVMLTTSLCIFGVIAGYGEADNFYRTNTKGLFVDTYNNFNKAYDKILKHIDKFSDWNIRFYENELRKKIIRFLKDDWGIKQAEQVLMLDRKEVVKLIEPQKFFIKEKEVFFHTLSKEQIEAVLFVMNGKLKLKFVHDSYFLNAFTNNKKKSMYELAGNQEKNKRTKFSILITYRIILSLMMGLILSGLVVDQTTGASAGTIAINLITRLFSLFSAITWGFYVAYELVKDDCVFLEYKIQVLEIFYNDVEVNKTFVPLTDDEKARKEYIDFYKNQEIKQIKFKGE